MRALNDEIDCPVLSRRRLNRGAQPCGADGAAKFKIEEDEPNPA
jgi:hypothetical protein